MAFPVVAVPTALIRFFAMEKRTMSKMKARRATVAEKPETQVLQQVPTIWQT